MAIIALAKIPPDSSPDTASAALRFGNAYPSKQAGGAILASRFDTRSCRRMVSSICPMVKTGSKATMGS